MKQLVFVAILVTATINCKAQSLAISVFNKGDSLYNQKQYLSAARTYTSALGIMGQSAMPQHHWYAAEAWALAGRTDSAFYQLHQVIQHDSLNFSDYRRIKADRDLELLHQDVNWQPLLDEMFRQARKSQLTILPNTKIPMRDGVRLNATVYKPSVKTKKLPVIFTLTPYIGDTYHERGSWFARRGFVYVIVDVRGRGSSEGHFYPFRNEADDGADIVAWLAHQPFSNGKVAMWGGSYAGFDQWATAKSHPAGLSTIVPTASVMPGVDFPMVDNVFGPYAIQWLTLTGGHNFNENLFGDQAYWNGKFVERLWTDLPLTKLDSVVGYPNSVWKDYMRHPVNGPFYKAMIPSASDYRRMQMPILTITGAYDSDQTGALSYYRAFMEHASATARHQHYLLIGPWDHAGTRTPKKIQGGVEMGDSSLLDMNQLHLDWYNHVTRADPLPILLRDKIVYYIAGADQWKTAKALEDIGRHKQSLYLAAVYSKENKNDSGTLRTTLPGEQRPITYTFNPLDLDKTYGIWYEGPLLGQDQIIAGFFALDLYLQTNVKDIDIKAEIVEITSAGKWIPLAWQTMRARYRDDLEKPNLLIPGKTTLLHFNRFNFIARRLSKGSHLRLLVSTPSQSVEEVNFCSGGVVQQETRKEARVAEVKLLNQIGANSVLQVPLAD